MSKILSFTVKNINTHTHTHTHTHTPHVGEGLHQGDGAHGPVAAERGGQQQQASVHTQQVVVGELAGRGGGHAGRVIEPVDKTKM